MVQSIEDYWNISNQINSRRNQTSILYIKFSVFFRWKAVHENACKGLPESTENCWNSFQGVNLERQYLQVYFYGIRQSLIFLTERRGSTFVTPERVHRNYHISMYLLRNVIFHLLPKEKICFQEKNTIFPENTRKIMSQRDPFEKTIFSESLKKRSYFRVFF